MTKEMRKSIMNRSKLRIKFLKSRNEEYKRLFNRQRNFCVSLLRKTKRRFQKAFQKESIILNNNNKTISNNEELAELFNKHFSKLVKNLDIDETLACNIASSDISDPVFNAIKKYEDHPNIKKIKHFMSGKDLQFSLSFETKNKILAEIHNLDKKKLVKKVLYR